MLSDFSHLKKYRKFNTFKDLSFDEFCQYVECLIDFGQKVGVELDCAIINRITKDIHIELTEWRKSKATSWEDSKAQLNAQSQFGEFRMLLDYLFKLQYCNGFVNWMQSSWKDHMLNLVYWKQDVIKKYPLVYERAVNVLGDF